MTVTLTTTPSLCNTCIWRRNVAAPRMASSIYTSNHGSGRDRLRTGRADGDVMPFHHNNALGACFEPEWNSARVNKNQPHSTGLRSLWPGGVFCFVVCVFVFLFVLLVSGLF